MYAAKVLGSLSVSTEFTGSRSDGCGSKHHLPIDIIRISLSL